MNYLTAKESRVEKAWNKRGIAGLRSELLLKVAECHHYGWDDAMFMRVITHFVFYSLPVREWDNALLYIEETCALSGVILSDYFHTLVAEARISEESMREEIGDE